MNDVLTKYIRNVIKEDESLLKKWAKGNEIIDQTSEDENTLLKLGLTPIPQGKHGTSFLGAGMYQSAYEVLWNNKRVVAKITSSENDVEALLDFSELKQQVPKEMSKHLMTVYDTFQSFNETRGEDEYIVLVEYLIPLSTTLVRDLYGSERKDTVNPYKKEEIESITYDEVKEVVISSIEGLSHSYFHEKIFDSSEFNDVVRVSYDGVKNFVEVPGHRGSVEYKFDEKILPRLKSKIDDMIFNYKIKIPSKNLINFIVDDLDKLLNRKVFPDIHGDDEWKIKRTLRHKDKRVKEFMEFLQYLADEHQIYWKDLHQENVMMRPGTGDLVVSDPGLF